MAKAMDVAVYEIIVKVNIMVKKLPPVGLNP